ITLWISVGALAMTRKISLVAACCSAPSRITFACAAMVCFNFATESDDDAARVLGLVFLRLFLAIRDLIQIRNPNIESGPADRNKPVQNKSQTRKIQNIESELGSF